MAVQLGEQDVAAAEDGGVFESCLHALDDGARGRRLAVREREHAGDGDRCRLDRRRQRVEAVAVEHGELERRADRARRARLARERLVPAVARQIEIDAHVGRAQLRELLRLPLGQRTLETRRSEPDRRQSPDHLAELDRHLIVRTSRSGRRAGDVHANDLSQTLSLLRAVRKAE